MDSAKIARFVGDAWDAEIVPKLVEYIRIPNKSPMFDSNWQSHGFMDEATDLLADWARLNWRARLNLVRRSASAFWDALWMQSYRWEDAMIQDLRYGVRMLLKHKSFTAVAILSLALGIGANTAIFQLLDAVRLRTLPVKAP